MNIVKRLIFTKAKAKTQLTTFRSISNPIVHYFLIGIIHWSSQNYFSRIWFAVFPLLVRTGSQQSKRQVRGAPSAC